MVWARSKIVEMAGFFWQENVVHYYALDFTTKKGCSFLGSHGELTRHLAVILKIFGYTKPSFAVNIYIWLWFFALCQDQMRKRL